MQEQFSDLRPNLGGFFQEFILRWWWCGITPPKTRQNYAGNFKFGTQVHTHVNSENIPFSTQTLKNQRFLAKIIPLLEAILWELCQRLFRDSIYTVMASFPSKTVKITKKITKFYMNIISDRDIYRDKSYNVFVTYLWALKQLTSFFISIFSVWQIKL